MRSYSRSGLLRYKIAPKYPLSGPFHHSGIGRNPEVAGRFVAITSFLHTLVRGGLTRVCKGFLRWDMASNLQVGLGFWPGFRQQPDAAPEPTLEEQPSEPVDAMSGYADGAARPAPGVAMYRSWGLGRCAQVARGDSAVIGVFHPGAVGQGQQGGHRQHQPVAGDAGRVGAAGLVPLPAQALDDPPVGAEGKL